MATRALCTYLVCAVSYGALAGCGRRDNPSVLREPAGNESEGAHHLTLVNEVEARRQAADDINRELKGRKFLAPGGHIEWVPISPQVWHSVIYDYRAQRIVLRFGGSGGWQGRVTMDADGGRAKVEEVQFAWN